MENSWKVLKSFGIAQIVLGTLMIAVGVSSVVLVEHSSSDIAAGIWTGIWVSDYLS